MSYSTYNHVFVDIDARMLLRGHVRFQSMIEVEPEDQDISTLGDPVYGGPTGIFTAANVFQGDEPTSER